MSLGEVRANTALTDTGIRFGLTAAELYDTDARIGSEQLRAADQNYVTHYQPAEVWGVNANGWTDVPPPHSPAVGSTQGHGAPSYTGNHHRAPVEPPTGSTLIGYARVAAPRPVTAQDHPSRMANPTVIERAPQHVREPQTIADRRGMSPEQVHSVPPANAIAQPLGAVAANVLVIPGLDGTRQGTPPPLRSAYTPGVRLSTEVHAPHSGRAVVQSTHTQAAAFIAQNRALAPTSSESPARSPFSGSGPAPQLSRHTQTPDAFDRTTRGAASYEDLRALVDTATDGGEVRMNADYGDIEDDWHAKLKRSYGNSEKDWHDKLAPTRRPAGYMQDTSEIIIAMTEQAPQAPAAEAPQPIAAPAKVMPKQTTTTHNGEVLEMPTPVGLIPDLNEPFDRKAVDYLRAGILVPGQEILSSKADPKYSGRHELNRRTERQVNTYRGERVTKSHIVRTAARIGSFIKKTVLYTPAMAGYTLAGNETYTHYLPMLLHR